MLDDEATPAHGEEVGGEGGGGGDAGPSDVAPSGEGGSNLHSSFGVVPLEKEEHTPPLTLSLLFSGLNPRLDATDERK